MVVDSDAEDTSDCVLIGNLDGDTLDFGGEWGVSFSLVPVVSDDIS